ncbi:RhuM family protein [Xenorhabdus cabanillasii]
MRYAVISQIREFLIKIDRANHREDNMGLYFISGTFPTKNEIEVGKNYLKPDELYRLHLLSEQFLLYAESTALQGKAMTMHSLHAQLDRLLTLNDYDVFPGYQDYLKDTALDHARQEFERYKKKKIIEDAGYTYDEELVELGEYDFLFEDES